MDQTFSPAEVIEWNIEEYASRPLNCNLARENIRRALLQLSGMPGDASLSFSDIFERLATNTSLPEIKQFSTLTIRLISCNGLLPEAVHNSVGRHLVKLIEQGNKAIESTLSNPKKSMTHDRLAVYARFHSEACQSLKILTKPISGLHDLVGRRQSIMQTLNNGLLKSYLNPLGFQTMTTSIGSILSLVDQTIKSENRESQTNLQNLLETVNDELRQL